MTIEQMDGVLVAEESLDRGRSRGPNGGEIKLHGRLVALD